MAPAWQGTTADGLTRLAQDYLCTLLTTFEGRPGRRPSPTPWVKLTEPRHTEKLMVAKGLLTITPHGRLLTEAERGSLCLWRHEDAVICEITDAGHITNPLVGRRTLFPATEGGRSLNLGQGRLGQLLGVLVAAITGMVDNLSSPCLVMSTPS